MSLVARVRERQGSRCVAEYAGGWMLKVSRNLRRVALLACATIACLFALAPAAPAAQDPPPATEESYRTELEAARGLMRTQSWKQAQQAWLEIISAHAGAAYVRPQLEEIRLQLRRASFWTTTRAPKLRDLLSGELLSYEPGSGMLKIRYTPKSLGDFAHGSGAASNVYMHPAHFKSSWSIVLEGSPAQVAEPSCLMAVDDSGYGVRFGKNEVGDTTYTIHVLFRFDPRGNKDLATFEPKPRKGSSPTVEARIHVDAHSTQAFYDGAQVLTSAREADDFGKLVLVTHGDFGQLTLAGAIDSGWIDGVMDAAVTDKRRAFDAAWVDPPEFAQWAPVGHETIEDVTLEGLLAGLKVEVQLTPQQKESFRAMEEGIAQDREHALAVLDALPAAREDARLPAEACSLLEFAAAIRLGRFEFALSRLADLRGLEGRQLETALLHATLLGSARRLEESAAEFEVLARAHPDLSAVHLKLVDTLLRLGRPGEARAAMQRALSTIPSSPALKELELKVVKADIGPVWKQSFEYTGQYFTVCSDVGVKLCRDAVRVLDKAMQRCVFEFGALPDAKAARSVAYLFSGEASYREYVHGIADKSAEQTLGIYSIALKQVVAWNQPDPERLWDVLRHECMHRYVDLRIGEVSRWFGEGLAETFAASGQRDETWKGGTLRPDWISLLRKEVPTLGTLAEFANRSDAQFFATVEQSYALSWAWIHYLRFGNADGRAIFAAHWAALLAGKDDSVAIDEAIANRDPRKLQSDFAAFLGKLLEE